MTESLYTVLKDVLAASSVQEATDRWKTSQPTPARKPSSSLMRETVNLADTMCPPSPWFTDIVSLCESGNLEAVQLCVQIGGEESLVGIPLPWRKRGVHIADPENCMIGAINSENSDLVKYILECGYDIKRQPIDYGRMSGLTDFKVCSLLLDWGCPLEEVDEQGIHILPILLSEPFEGQYDLARRIIPHVQIENILDSDPDDEINCFQCSDPRIIELLLDRLEAEQMNWRDGTAICISPELPYELRLRLLRELTRVEFFAQEYDFEVSLRHAQVSLADLTDLANNYPTIDFPPKSKSARPS